MGALCQNAECDSFRGFGGMPHIILIIYRGLSGSHHLKRFSISKFYADYN